MMTVYGNSYSRGNDMGVTKKQMQEVAEDAMRYMSDYRKELRVAFESTMFIKPIPGAICNADNVRVPEIEETKEYIHYYDREPFKKFFNKNNRKEKEMNIYVCMIGRLDDTKGPTDEVLVRPELIVGRNSTIVHDNFMLEHAGDIEKAGGRKKVYIMCEAVVNN